MKNILYIKLLVVGLLCSMISCSDDTVDPGTGPVSGIAPEAVSVLNSPSNDSLFVLDREKENIVFRWDKVKDNGGGVVSYEVVFDKQGGDFSNPLATISADSKGFSNAATLTQDQLNNVAELAGVAVDATGSLIWTVRTSNGTKYTLGTVSNTTKVTRMQPLEIALISPDDDAVLALSSAGANVIFSWTAIPVNTGETISYSLLLDEKGNDFSNPLVVIESEANGTATQTNITQLKMDDYVGYASLQAGEAGDFIWTVRWIIKRTDGTSEEKVSTNVRDLNITRIPDGERYPTQLFAYGSATEVGGAGVEKLNFMNAFSITGVENVVHDPANRPDGNKTMMLNKEIYVFEIYTKLVAGELFLTDENNASYVLDFAQNKILLQQGATTVTSAEEGIYRIKLDFQAKTLEMVEIYSINFHSMNNNNQAPAYPQELTYQGKGTWKIVGAEIPLRSNMTARYKFWVESSDVNKVRCFSSIMDNPHEKSAVNYETKFQYLVEIGKDDYMDPSSPIYSSKGDNWDIYLYSFRPCDAKGDFTNSQRYGDVVVYMDGTHTPTGQPTHTILNSRDVK